MRLRRVVGVSILLTAVAALALLIAATKVGPASNSFAAASSSPTPIVSSVPALTPFRVTRALVSSLCTGNGTTLGQWNYVSPWLLCYNADRYTEGVALYYLNSSNDAFTIVQRGGGEYDVRYLENPLGVPAATAKRLVAGLHS